MDVITLDDLILVHAHVELGIHSVDPNHLSGVRDGGPVTNSLAGT